MSVYYTLDSTRTSTYKSLGGKGVAPSSCLIGNRHKDRAPEDNYGTIGFSCHMERVRSYPVWLGTSIMDRSRT